MRIYKDLRTGDELLTDTSPIKEIAGGFVFEVSTKYIVIKSENDFDIGANASAEETEEKLENAEKQMIDLVYAQRLQEASFAKKDYMNHIKTYMKWLKENVKEEDRSKFEGEAQGFVKSMLGKFDELCFYTGESMDSEAGMVILCLFSEDGMSQKFYFWRNGLKEEKV
eukprot:GGOE01013517.1.p1 GENE.GGOE01013517.1~~GGOE01013517.1.p1  ORF type:complete len:168 (+),score=46.98 GGOE01013517.1:96-599(+)